MHIANLRIVANRKTKKGKQPDLKCKNSECDNAIWMDSWEKDLMGDIADALAADAISEKVREQMEAPVIARDVPKMLRVEKKLNELTKGLSA